MIDETGRLADIHDALRHVSAIFPDDTNLTCTFTAAAGAHTWSGWTEIVDSGATTLSSFFADARGHISALHFETYSDINALYMVELAWGDNHVVIGRARFAATGKFTSSDTKTVFHAPASPAGETVYYRMKTDTGVADTIILHIRHHTHP